MRAATCAEKTDFRPLLLTAALMASVLAMLACTRTVLGDDAVSREPVSAPRPEAAPAEAAVPLHERIDALIEAAQPDYAVRAAPVADDAEFLRRVSLDLAGMPPTADQVREFLASEDPSKRAQAIDRLLSGPEYARRMQRVFDVMLMRRLPQKVVPVTEWQEWLRTGFEQNRPWHEMVQEILSNDGSDVKNRGAARFYLDRDGDADEITRDIARIFLGANLECAQCHDHPEIDGFHQEHYYGIKAFLVRSFVFDDKKAKTKVFAEKAEGEVSFESVFEVRDKTSKGPRSVGPQLFADVVLTEPELKKEELYIVKPEKNVRPVPKFSRRSQLPEAIASAENRRFARTTANRLWKLLLGRGLIHPVDLDHELNPPSHPELMELLTDELLAHQFDLKWFLREICLSRTYQRSSQLPEGQTADPLPPEAFGQAILRPLGPAQFGWAVAQATGETDIHRASLGEKLSEAELQKRIQGVENRFVSLFGGQPGKPPEGFESTVDQVLFLSNDAMVQNLIKPRGSNLAARLLALPADQPAAIAEELFLTTLNRPPSSDDIADVTGYLNGLEGEERSQAVQELVWALVASSELRFNH